MDAPIDDDTKRTVQKIPLLATRAGPRDGENWTKRLKEEYLALIQVRFSFACFFLYLSRCVCVDGRVRPSKPRVRSTWRM